VGVAHALRARDLQQPYPPEVIAPWSASPPPSQYARLLGQGGCVVAEDGRVSCSASVCLIPMPMKSMRCSSILIGRPGVGQALMQRLLAMADRERRGGAVGLAQRRAVLPTAQRFISVREETTRIPAAWRWLR
jgi:hypothetical protein